MTDFADNVSPGGWNNSVWMYFFFHTGKRGAPTQLKDIGTDATRGINTPSHTNQ